ncbi:MAG: beta-ketoacyl-[acyl-carrier-protein] synthase family protein [Saprospiraceae bacterium]
MNRALISGMGVVCSIANSVSELEVSLRKGLSGYKNIQPERFDLSDNIFKSRSACVLDADLYSHLVQQDRTILYEISLNAITQALQDAGIELGNYEDPTRVALCMGTSIGGGHAFAKWMKSVLNQTYDYESLQMNHTYIARKLAKATGIKGGVSVVDTACASGGNAIGRAYDLIKDDRADIVIAGGVDVISYLTYCGFNSVFAISPQQCKPFDANRTGLNLGDAAAFVVVEKETAIAGKKEAYAEIGGYAILNEAYHATAPHPEGIYAKAAMEKAIQSAGVSLNEINYVNAHGTSTKANDTMEMKAIDELFKGNEVYVSSSKSMLGHTLGAAGGIEALITALAINKGFIPPSINIDQPVDAGHNVHIVKECQSLQIKAALSNSFAFAGNLASILLKQYKTI